VDYLDFLPVAHSNYLILELVPLALVLVQMAMLLPVQLVLM
jgi:hypothetical protein